MNERLLVAVDESPASRKALEYLARFVGGRPENYVHVVHLLPPPPVTPTESGFTPLAVDPVDAWMNNKKEEARLLLEGARDDLCSAGVARENVDIGYLSIPSTSAMADGLMDLAQDNQCSTIVVGRNSLPWYRELFHAHPADALVRKARDVTVWIVE